MVGVFCVGEGIAQRTADRFGVLGAGATRSVAQRVAGRSAEESHIDVQFSISYGAAAAAVRTEHNRLLHEAV